jgi:hypothetical protein
MPNRGPKLKLVDESEATGRAGQIFGEVRQALGVPYTGLVFRAYGAYPLFLDLFWTSVQSATADARFFLLADRLRATAYTRVYSYFSVPDFCLRAEQMRLSAGARRELTDTVDLLYYYNALQLLLAAVALQAFDKPVGRVPSASNPAEHAEFRVRPVLVDEGAATPRVARTYDEIKRTFGAPVVNTDFRAFARFPDFLEDFWAVLRPLTESPLYAESQFGVQDAAIALAREFPGEVNLTKERLEKAGIDDDTVAAVVRATELFMKILSSSLLNLALAKIGLDGGSSLKPAPTHAEPSRAA